MFNSEGEKLFPFFIGLVKPRLSSTPTNSDRSLPNIFFDDHMNRDHLQAAANPATIHAMANQPPEDNEVVLNPFVNIPQGSALDPSSPNFNANEWFTKFAAFMSYCSPQPPLRVGVS